MIEREIVLAQCFLHASKLAHEESACYNIQSQIPLKGHIPQAISDSNN